MIKLSLPKALGALGVAIAMGLTLVPMQSKVLAQTCTSETVKKSDFVSDRITTYKPAAGGKFVPDGTVDRDDLAESTIVRACDKFARLSVNNSQVLIRRSSYKPFCTCVSEVARSGSAQGSAPGIGKVKPCSKKVCQGN